MLRTPLRSVCAVTFLGIALSACHDLPTAAIPTEHAPPTSSIESRDAPAFSRSGRGRNEPRFVCYASERDSEAPVHYRYTRFAVHFPASAEAPDGATMIYRYRLIGEVDGADPIGAANCRIPKTPEAVEIMNRRLGVDDRRRRGRSGGDEGLVTTMSCPKTGCVLEGITAYGYAQPRVSTTHTPSTIGCWYSCGWGASYYDEGGGSTWDPYTPEPTNEPAEPCNTGDAFLDDPVVNQGFDELWKASNASANLAHRVEQLGWIVRTATGFRIAPFGTGNFCG